MANKGHSSMVFKGQHSPATAYLLSVLEKKTREDTFHAGGSDVDRVTTAFDSLAEILPHCGVYSPVLKLVKEELFNAVYSDTYTASQNTTFVQGKKNVKKSPKLEKVPYFVLLERLQEQRNETAETLQKQVKSIGIKLEENNLTIGEKDVKLKEITNCLNDVEKELVAAKIELQQKRQAIIELNSIILENQKVADEKQLELAQELNLHLEKKQQLQDENNVLRPYKMNYDTLKDTFDLPPEKRPKRGFRRPILATKKTQLLSSIEAASKLEQQILEIQNKTLEEHDKYLEEVKEKLSEKKFSENSNDPNYYNEELVLESMGDEMTNRQQNFQRLVSGMVVELELVRAHREALQNELSQLEQVELGARAVADGDGSLGRGTMAQSSMAGGRPGSSRMMLLDDGKKNGTDSQLSTLGESALEEDNTKLTDPSTDPFNPQERVLSKYSAMLYTSCNSGKTFDEIMSAKFCVSCGEKTAICPHKVTKDDMIIRLPKGCTHVKVARPQVRIAISMSQLGVPQTASTLHPGRAGADTWLSSRQEPHGWDASGDWMLEEETRQQLAALWDDFKTRTGTEMWSLLPVSRDLSHARVLSLIEQLYASIIWHDDHPTVDGDESIGTIKDYLYNFISERYQEDEITPMATFDFLAGVLKYATQDKIILLFGQVTAGHIDGSVARYIHLIADLIDIVLWKEVKDFVGLSEALYPFIPEEDIDQFVIEYTAFSENKISKSLLMEYFIHIVLKNKEPRIQEAESKLSSVQVAVAGNMQMKEFITAMETVAPLTNEQLWRKLMKETYRFYKDDSAPISSLAGIVAYVSFVQVIPLLKDQLVNRIENARKLRKNEVSTKLSTSNQLVSETGRLVTMHEMKQLGFNVSRQRQAGARQMDNEFEDFYWQSRPNTQDSIA